VATLFNLADTSIKAERPSGKLPTFRVHLLISRFILSRALLVRIRVNSYQSLMSSKLSKLLFLSPSSSLGGAERVLLNILRPLVSGCFEIKTKLVLVEDGPLVHEISKLDVCVEKKEIPLCIRRIGDSPSRKETLIGKWAKMVFLFPSLLYLLFKWKKWLKYECPSLIHSNGFKTHILAGLCSPRNTLIYWHLHDFVGDRPLAQMLLKKAWRPGIQALAISRSVADDFSKVLPECPVRVWYNTVDCEKFYPFRVDGHWLDVEAGFSDNFEGIRIGLVATYARWKGHDVFLRACRLLTEKFKNKVRFYLIGGPVYQTIGSQWTLVELRDIINDFGLNDVVGLVPFQNDTSKVYQSLDVVVHASTRREPFGLVITEAMACGKAVVAALHGGASEIGEDGIDCIGHKPGVPVSLAAAIETLIQDEVLRHKLGANARARVLMYFNDGKILQNWQELLQEVGEY
jgi:glycosyltransferase involved in cell wall biosynthesis